MILEAIRQAQELHRTVIEETYTGRCTVRERRKEKRPNGAMGFQECVVQEDIPCRLIFKSAPAAEPSAPATPIRQIIKLLMAPEVEISPGAKITVSQNRVTEDYTRSGTPAVYATHQEISLELFKGYA